MGPSARLEAAEGTDELGLLARTLNEMLDRVDQAVARERRLIDRASHELRTPLAIQRMDLDLARSGPQTVEELSSALVSAAEENEHLVRLADDLLVLSRARGGQLPVDRRPASVRALLDEAVRRNEARAVAAGVTLAATGADGTADVDPDRIRQALDDLIDNSLRVTPPGGRIEVGADADGGRIWVEDSGGGFQEAFLPRAFDPFARDVGGSRDDDGAGLGLAIVRAIAQAHGGTATAENIPGGARVTMILADEDESTGSG